ncbi:hypothetical protein E2C01_035269 [Portunus trituberculatus]|uniref:Uncharacterized protein n=1 Tax=Portunus trituberculatus TaxID=210409 RepID=A0A5B7F9A8_PORTR|nr:hypothetical protein [Portunus trituberculatus]
MSSTSPELSLSASLSFLPGSFASEGSIWRKKQQLCHRLLSGAGGLWAVGGEGRVGVTEAPLDIMTGAPLVSLLPQAVSPCPSRPAPRPRDTGCTRSRESPPKVSISWTLWHDSPAGQESPPPEEV